MAQKAKILYMPDKTIQTYHGCKGDLESWRRDVAAPCDGNPLMMFFMSHEYAAPLLYHCGEENGGSHVYGESSGGKTTAVLVAGSFHGGGGPDGAVLRWRTTDNGLEGISAAFNDQCLPMDDIGQADAKHMGQMIYMLGNGQGKIRSDTSGNTREVHEFRLLWLSSGEKSVAEHIGEGTPAGITAGQVVRCIDLKNPGFTDLHGAANGAEFSMRMKAAAKSHFGWAFHKWIDYLEEARPQPVADAVLRTRARVMDELTKAEGVKPLEDGTEETIPAGPYHGVSSQQRRVLARCVWIGVIGSLAVKKGHLPWSNGFKHETTGRRGALGAALACFDIWMGDEQKIGQQNEEQRAIAAVKSYISSYGGSRFLKARREANGTAAMTDPTVHGECSGVEVMDMQTRRSEWYLHTAVMDRICRDAGLSRKYVVMVLSRKHLLDEPSIKRHTKKLPRSIRDQTHFGHSNMYCVKDDVMLS